MGNYKWFSLKELWDTGYDKKGGMILYHNKVTDGEDAFFGSKRNIDPDSKNEITLEEAEHYFRKEPFEKMGGYAKLDSHREVRSGFPEVILLQRQGR